MDNRSIDLDQKKFTNAIEKVIVLNFQRALQHLARVLSKSLQEKQTQKLVDHVRTNFEKLKNQRLDFFQQYVRRNHFRPLVVEEYNRALINKNERFSAKSERFNLLVQKYIQRTKGARVRRLCKQLQQALQSKQNQSAQTDSRNSQQYLKNVQRLNEFTQRKCKQLQQILKRHEL